MTDSDSGFEIVALDPRRAWDAGEVLARSHADHPSFAFYVIDVLAERPLAGNPLVLVDRAAELDEGR